MKIIVVKNKKFKFKKSGYPLYLKPDVEMYVEKLKELNKWIKNNKKPDQRVFLLSKGHSGMYISALMHSLNPTYIIANFRDPNSEMSHSIAYHGSIETSHLIRKKDMLIFMDDFIESGSTFEYVVEKIIEKSTFDKINLYCFLMDSGYDTFPDIIDGGVKGLLDNVYIFTDKSEYGLVPI